MNENKAKLEQNQRDEPMSLLSRSLTTGLVGGILWSIIGVIMYYFNFSEVAPKSYLIRTWTSAEWSDSWLGHVLSILGSGLFSVAVALVYYGLFRKMKSMWVGVLFGVALWAVIFLLLQPIFAHIPSFLELNSYTILSGICLFILYGTFIGYSISYDYQDTKLKEASEQEAAN